jgi:hypothetical protein
MLKTPPRFVPTLTQVIPDAANRGSQNASFPASTSKFAAASVAKEVRPEQASDIAQQLRQKLLLQARQHLDITLQTRIREVVAQLALEHAHKLFEELQPQLETTITQAVDEAMAHAVAHVSAHVSAHGS